MPGENVETKKRKQRLIANGVYENIFNAFHMIQRISLV